MTTTPTPLDVLAPRAPRPDIATGQPAPRRARPGRTLRRVAPRRAA